LNDIIDLSIPNEDFMNAFDTALGGSNGNQIYGVIFQSNSNGGVDVVYTIDNSSNVSNAGFPILLDVSIRAESGLESLFGKKCFFQKVF
jgi:hypothetical protein